MWTPERARKVASEHLEGTGRRWEHVRAVGELAESLVNEGYLDDVDVVMAAWLHDVGYAEELQTTGFHPLDGARYLDELGAPESVVALVGRHTGADYEAEERGLHEELSGLPEPDPEALEILTLLDLVTSPSGDRITPEHRIAEILDRYPQSSPVFRAVSRSHGTLLAMAERAREELGLADDWPALVAVRVGKA